MTTPVVMHVDGAGEVWAWRGAYGSLAASKFGVTYSVDEPRTVVCWWEMPHRMPATSPVAIAYRKHLELKR